MMNLEEMALMRKDYGCDVLIGALSTDVKARGDLEDRIDHLVEEWYPGRARTGIRKLYPIDGGIEFLVLLFERGEDMDRYLKAFPGDMRFIWEDM